MLLKGKIRTIFKQKLYAKQYAKREFVLQTDEQCPQFLIMEFINDECKILDEFNINDVVDVDFNLRGTEWTNPKGEKVYFKSIRVNKIRKLDGNYQNFKNLDLYHFLMEINKNQN